MSLLASQKLLDLNLQRRNFPGDHTPDKLDADTEIPVNELVSHARDTLPRNVGVRILEINRKTLDRFSDDLQIADHSVLCSAVSEKGVLPRCDIFGNVGDSVRMCCK